MRADSATGSDLRWAAAADDDVASGKWLVELYGRELFATDDTSRLVEDVAVLARQYGSGRYMPTVGRLGAGRVAEGCRLMEVAVRFSRPAFSTPGGAELSGRICSSDLKRVAVGVEELGVEEGAEEDGGGSGIQSALPRYGTEPVGTWADDRYACKTHDSYSLRCLLLSTIHFTNNMANLSIFAHSERCKITNIIIQ